MKKMSTIYALLLLAFVSSMQAVPVKGTYIGVRGVDADDAVMDQFTFHTDGTAYWNQLSGLQSKEGGKSLVEIGTWKKSVNNMIIVTTIGATALPAPNTNGVTIDKYTRNTQYFKINGPHQLRAVRRVFKTFELDEDPLQDEGTIILDSSESFTLDSIEIHSSDLS